MKSVPETIYDAQTGVYDIPRVTDTVASFDIQTAYRYQAELVARFVAEGRQRVGYKMGLTSRKKMQQMNVKEAAHGVLFEDMYLRDGKLQYERLIHPKAEPEIAVRIGKDVPKNVNSDTLLDYIGEIAPAIDIIDSRFKNFDFTIPDVVADNCSAAQFAIGTWVPFHKKTMVLDNIKAALLINDELMTEGSSYDVMGDPIYAIYDLQRALAKEDILLKEGDIILTGAMTQASTIKEGDIIENQTGIGNVQIS